MTEELNELDLRVGQRRLGRLMRQNGIRIIRSQLSSSAPQTAITPSTSRRTSCNRTFRRVPRTRSGRATSPTSGRVRAGFTHFKHKCFPRFGKRQCPATSRSVSKAGTTLQKHSLGTLTGTPSLSTKCPPLQGNYLWSPTAQSNGRRSEFYENMKRLRPGDVVFAFAAGEIKAVGICSAPAILAPKPGEFGMAGNVWSNEGWRVPVEFTRLSTPLRPKDHIDVLAPTLPEKYSPIKPDGNGNQGAYLATVPVKMA
jgi:hypothetical protein